MKLAVGADERLHVAEIVLNALEEDGHDVTWFGPEKGETEPWPEVARQVAEAVATGQVEEGILFCWTGTGVSIAANWPTPVTSPIAKVGRARMVSI